MPLVIIDHVVKEFAASSRGIMRRGRGTIKAVSGVSFTVSAGETFGLVGESGCGKTTLARIIVGLEGPTSGGVTVDGVRITSLDATALRRHRSSVQFVFQDPYSSLDPRMRIGDIVREPLLIQHVGSKGDQIARAGQLLSEVGLGYAVARHHPHELSGGERQRVALARALALSPALVVADEPVSALDATVRSQILTLMGRLQQAHGLTYIVISHDLSVVGQVADRIGVMYLGKIVEMGTAETVYQRPAHPYTAALIGAIPVPDPAVERAREATPSLGELASAVDPPSGCRYRTRCPRAHPVCADDEPDLRGFAPGQVAACHFPLQPPA